LRAVFLDRDGVLNRDTPGFITNPDDLEVLPGAADAVARLNRAGLIVAVITNQSGVGRGLMTACDLSAVHERLAANVAQAGGSFAGIYHCPHAPWERCACRKPLPGMVLRACEELGIHSTRSYFVGDKPTDIECGAATGCTTVLVLSGLEPVYDAARFDVRPDHVCADLAAATDWILNQAGSTGGD